MANDSIGIIRFVASAIRGGSALFDVLRGRFKRPIGIQYKISDRDNQDYEEHSNYVPQIQKVYRHMHDASG